MNQRQLAIWELAREDLNIHFDVGQPASEQEAVDRLKAIAFDALAAIDKLEKAS